MVTRSLMRGLERRQNMRQHQSLTRTLTWSIVVAFLFCATVIAQSPASLDGNLMDRDQKPEALQTTSPESGKEQTTTAPSPASQVVTLPAGSKVLMALQSPLDTTSGVEGSGIYLETVFPVVQENHVVIPVRTQVLGVVDAEKRPDGSKAARNSDFISPAWYSPTIM